MADAAAGRRDYALRAARRQRARRPDGLLTYVDADYEGFGVIVELDGQAFHDGPRHRDRDAARDLANLADADELTARVTHGLVFDTPCTTAAHVARLLRRRGWRGDLSRCRACREAA